MKYINNPYRICIAAILILCVYGCGKSGGSNPTPTKPVVKTAAQLLVSGPWTISALQFVNATTNTPLGSAIPDSLANLVLTLHSDNTFTETGGKTASGTWVFVTTPNQVLTLTTTSGTASTIPWTCFVTASALDLSNNRIHTTYINPSDTPQAYIGEAIEFAH